MIIQPLDAADNKTVRRVRSLMTNRGLRERLGVSVLEGVRLVEAAILSGAEFRIVLYGPRLVQTERGRALVGRLSSLAPKLLYVSEKVLSELAEVETSQGILAVASMPPVGSLWPFPTGAPPLFVAADGIQDPGNLGTIIRSAQAAGVHAFGVSKGTVDIFNPKTLRATAGSLFEMPMVRLEETWSADAKRQNLTLVCSVVNGGMPYEAFDWTQPLVLVLGSEGHGVTPMAMAEALSIPMAPTANSLNVASAAAVLLFHAAQVRRQRQFPMLPPSRVEYGRRRRIE
ncbi:MAG: RNA methyltransferase [Firmicutes bacterium]|nr:RNA methyltransferase [Bacillota bacterium]